MFHIPGGCKWTIANKKDIYFLGRNVGDINLWSDSTTKRFQLVAIDYKAVAKCFSESDILLADHLKIHSSSPKSKLATSRSRTRSTLA